MDQALLWKKGLACDDEDTEGKEDQAEGEEEEPKEEDSCDEESGEYRDKGKGQKWKKMCDANAIPSHILQMFNQEAKKQKNPRIWKTKIINKLFSKNKKTGKYEMVANQPFFNDFKEASSSDFGKEQVKGEPKSVFSKFHGSQEGLAHSIALGDVLEWEQDGTTWCSYKSTTAGTKKKNTQKTQVGKGQVEITDEQHSFLNKSLKSMCWTFGQGQPASGAASSSQLPPAKRTKAIEMEGLTPKMVEMLTEAKMAIERQLNTALKLVKDSPDEQKQTLKGIIMTIKAAVQKAEHMLLFKDCCVCFFAFLNDV